MRLLSDDELRRLRPAETAAFAGPIPTQIVSSDEYFPAPQSATQRQVEARTKALGDALAKRQGMSRRRFFPDRERDGGGLPGHERGVRTALRRDPRRSVGQGQGGRALERPGRPVHHGHPYARPARRHAHRGLRARPADAQPCDLHARLPGLARGSRSRHRRPHARFLQGLHHRRQHPQGQERLRYGYVLPRR
jgi:hypothetical protein